MSDSDWLTACSSCGERAKWRFLCSNTANCPNRRFFTADVLSCRSRRSTGVTWGSIHNTARKNQQLHGVIWYFHTILIFHSEPSGCISWIILSLLLFFFHMRDGVCCAFSFKHSRVPLMPLRDWGQGGSMGLAAFLNLPNPHLIFQFKFSSR